MSFVDTALVVLQAGDGGDGRTSFRHEKFIDRGGPDGGDGGDGGDVVFVASRNQNTLASFRFQKELKAESGVAGDKRRRHGKNGQDLRVLVPVGTTLINEEGTLLADLVTDGVEAVIAQGGKGGFGNAHFVSSTRQAPKVSEKGEPGQQLSARLELKMIADVGLVGLPNAGKSTLLSVVSNARPEIADYPFTTLTPNLGVVDVDKNHSLLVADIPGLIEGAAEGKGLGDDFLRHVERTAVLLHLIDAYQDDIASAYKTIQTELGSYKVDLTKRPQIVVLSKTEGLDKEMIADLTKQLRSVVPVRTPIVAISAQAGQGLPELLRQVLKTVDAERAKQAKKQQPTDNIPVLRLPDTKDAWQVKKIDGKFVVTGHKIERFAARTDFDNEHGIRRLRDIMKKMGIMHELSRQGAKAGNKIVIGTAGQLEY
jgi:GTP-binding protein